ncbi:MAG: TonB-dependent receptor, partial [Bacteroidota bacterium]
ISDLNGRYQFHNVPMGSYKVEFSYLGFEKALITIKINKNRTTTINQKLKPSTDLLSEVVILGESDAVLKSIDPIQMTVLESKDLRAQPLGARDLIKKATGVQVREQGGLGSNISFSLNGLSGRSVRIYLDGTPIEFLGNGLALNAIPISQVERVEVYKGVIPIDVATDALGGGINIITRNIKGTYMEATYQVGSFNTHRMSFIGKQELNPKMTLGFSGFYNFSDNNYRMRDVPNISFEVIENRFGGIDTVAVENRITARRFHNVHRSYFMEGNMQIYDTKWADKFKMSVGYTNRFDELQNGARVTRRPFGEATRAANQMLGTISYSKGFGDRWNVNQSSNFSYTRTFVDDSTTNIYDWEGNLLPTKDTNGAELGAPTQRSGINIGTSHRSTLKYSINKDHYLTASNFIGYNQIFGEDPVGNRITVRDVVLDPNEIKSSFRTNIFGFQYESSWLKDKDLSTTVFYKNYFYNAQAIDIDFPGDFNTESLPFLTFKRSFNGGGVALKYDISEKAFIRTSYERAIRIPTIREYFGNFANILQNLNLKPERSHNVNLGLNLNLVSSQNFTFNMDLNAFLRDQEDLIRLLALGDGAVSIFINEGQVRSQGVELSTNLKPYKNLKLDFNFTYQSVALSDSDDIRDDSFIGVQIPNIPNMLFNTSASYTFEGVFKSADRLNLFWSYFYVNRFSIAFVQDIRTANPDNIIPTQHDHSVGLSYSGIAKGLTFSARLNNVFDTDLFDNFRAPKPSRNIMLKIIYKLNRTNKN